MPGPLCGPGERVERPFIDVYHFQQLRLAAGIISAAVAVCSCHLSSVNSALSRGRPPTPKEETSAWAFAWPKKDRDIRLSGPSCFALQLALLTAMVRLGADRPVANAMAFAISAQLNFLLSSRVTWRDRPVQDGAAPARGGSRTTAPPWCRWAATPPSSPSLPLDRHDSGRRARRPDRHPIVYLTCNLLVFRRRAAAPVPEPQALLATEADQAVAQ